MSQLPIKEIVSRHGLKFAGEWLAYNAEFEWADSFALFSLLAMASCAIDGRVLINPGSKPEAWTNLYVVLYGPPGSRKSEAMLEAQRMLSDACPHAPIFPMNFTCEALRKRMHEDSEKYTRAPGLIMAEELSTLLGSAEYLHHNSLFLSKIWEGRPVETFLTVAHGEQIIRNAYPVLAACSTPEAHDDMDPKSIATGFLRRTLYIVEYGAARENAHPRPNTVLRNRLADLFKARMETLKPALMKLSEDALRLNQSWYDDRLRPLREKWPSGREGHFVNSMQVHAFKLAAVLQILEGGGSAQLEAASLAAGLELVEAIRPRMFEFYSTLLPTPFARLKAKVLRIAASQEGMTDEALDTEAGRQCGVPRTQAGEARLALLIEGMLTRDATGRLKAGGEDAVH